MPASTLSLASIGYRSAQSSVQMNSLMTAVQGAVNNHAALIDSGLGGGSAAVLNYVSAKSYGAIGDGAVHTVQPADIAAHTGGLFPWVGTYTVGVDQLDYIGIQEAIYAAFYSGTLTPNRDNIRLNRMLYIDNGEYFVNKALEIVDLKSGIIFGAGRLATKIKSIYAGPVVATEGVWYSHFKDLSFETTVPGAYEVFKLDGNIGGAGIHIGVQGNTFEQCYFVGNFNAEFGMTMVRQGGGSGQGSENLFLNCHFAAVNQYCYIQLGFNALANKFVGGDMQAFLKGGIAGVGSIQVDGTSFESTIGYTQIINDGYDIDMSGGGVFDVVTITGCRSESLRFCRGSGAQTPVITGFSHVPSIYPRAVQAYLLNDVVTGITAGGNFKLYRCTTAGTTVGAAPVWPEIGTVSDGTAVWTFTDFDVIYLSQGVVNQANIQLGSVYGNDGAMFSNISFRRKDPFVTTAANSRYLITGGNPEFSNCYYILTSGGALAPITGVGAQTFPNKIVRNIGDTAIVAISGAGGATMMPISLYRGFGSNATPILNWWDHVGGLRHTGLTFSQITTFGTAGNGMLQGVEVFCSDGAPTDPLTGGGTGCKAYFSNNRWKGI